MKSYSSIRNHIRDGDLIAVKRSRGGFWKLVRWVTGSDVTHTAVAIWLDDGLYAAEMDWAGNHLVPVSQYQVAFDVYASPVDGVVVRRAVLAMLRKRIKYDFGDLLIIAARNLFSLRSPVDTGGLVCSAFSARIYALSGWSARQTLPRIPSPGDLASALAHGKKFEVSPCQ